MMIRVADIVGENCITMQDGERIYDLLHSRLAQNQTVLLDFSGVSVFASPFFNAAVGRLLKDISPDTLNRCLRFEQLSTTGRLLLKRVIANSRDYYSSPEKRSSIDSILKKEAQLPEEQQ